MTEEAIPNEMPPVTSTVEVIGNMTIRAYSDGAIQRNVWESDERAAEYAASVLAQEGV